MLRIRVVSIGRDKADWLKTGCDHYLKLLSRYARVELIPLTSPKASPSLSVGEIKRSEADLLRKRTQGYTVALHDSGVAFDSRRFAQRLEKLQQQSGGDLTFLIGGAFGLEEELLAEVDLKLSLSPLTYSHELARLVLLEQLYRGYSILHNTGYHK